MQVAQGRQKATYDRGARKLDYRIGDRVMVHMPHESTRKAAKLARPFFGPYRVLSVTSSNAEVRLVDRPDEPSILCLLAVSGPVTTRFRAYRGVGMLLKGNDIQTEKFVKHLYKLLTSRILVQ